MANGTRVRDWATIDYYAVLGIAADADADEVTRAFRALAKQSHPDATLDRADHERFSDAAAAYAVLGDPRTRVEYDRVREGLRSETPLAAAPTAPVVTPKRRSKPWSRRRAWSVLIAGVLVTLLGIGAVWLTWSLHEHDARLRARYAPATATRIDVEGSSIVSFVTKTGERVRVPEPQQRGDPTEVGATVRIRYDPADPRHVILDDSNLARDITFSIVALKLLIGGPVFTGLGYRRLRGITAVR